MTGPTMNLRFVKRLIPRTSPEGFAGTMRMILQQEWIANYDTQGIPLREWRDVPVEEINV